MKKAVVIGGGITGLSAMHYLERMKQQHGLELELELIEKEEELGGKIRTVKKEGFTMEVGADSIVARHASVLPLIEEFGLEELDLLGSFSSGDLAPYRRQAESLEREIISIIEKNGVSIESYDTVKDFLSTN